MSMRRVLGVWKDTGAGPTGFAADFTLIDNLNGAALASQVPGYG
jgi:hypothetical protein